MLLGIIRVGPRSIKVKSKHPQPDHTICQSRIYKELVGLARQAYHDGSNFVGESIEADIYLV